MHLTACSIYDSVAEAWTRPMFVRSKGEAMRGFMDALQNPESDFSRHPEHYSLYAVGTFDEFSGELVSAEPQLLLCGRDVGKEGAE